MFETIKSFFKKTYSNLVALSVYEDVKYGSGSVDFLNYNEISLYVNRAIDIRAEKVSEIMFEIYKGDKKQEANDWLTLLQRPNQWHTGKQFWKLFQKYYDITGSVFILKQDKEKPDQVFKSGSKPVGLHLLRPDLVKIIFTSDGSDIEKYEYKNGSETVEYEKDQVLYCFNPDPMNPLKGASLLRAGVRQMETEKQLTDYQNKILKNGGKIEGVFSFKTQGGLNEKQLAELKDGYAKQYADAKKAGRPLFLGGDATYTNLALNPTELSYLATKKITLDDLCILTGVPKSILGVTEGETYANADASIAIFLREKIKPLMQNLNDFLDWRLIPADLELRYIDPTPEDVDRKLKIVESADKVHAVSINEKRKMLGFDEVKTDGADDIYIPFNLTALGTEESVESKKKSLSNEFVHPLRDPEIRKRYGEANFKKLEKKENETLRKIRNYFREQEQRILVKLPFAKEKALAEDYFNAELEAKIARDEILPIIREALRDAGIDTINTFDFGFDFTLSSTIESWLDKRADLFADSVTSTTYKDLVKQFRLSTEYGETFKDLAKRIQDVFDGYSESRALMIARTETHGAMQKGTFEAYKQANLPIKIWVWAPGDQGGVREGHMAMDGEEKPINMPFSNGLMFPGDPDGSASETINCACVG